MPKGGKGGKMPDRRNGNFKGPERKYTYQMWRAEGPPEWLRWKRKELKSRRQ